MSMNERYEPKAIEPRWQSRWEEAGAFRAGRRPGAGERYVLEMFPYPSGAMHMGHGRVYTIGDALARHLRMRGFDVLHPIGFDALGLPAENVAIKDGRHPDERTRENIVAFRAKLKKLGYSFDWDREISTCDAEYYRWNQWFFLRMLDRGVVYRREGTANWCTGCNTVIANEQVREILKRKNPDSTLICFEKNHTFYNLLGKTVRGRNFFVVNDDVFNAANSLSSRFEIMDGSVDCIISTLPCSSLKFDELLRKSVVPLLKDDGIFVQYMHTVSALKGFRLRPVLRSYFSRIDSDFVFLILPPALVYTCRM